MSEAPEDLRDLEQMHQDWLNAPTLSAAMQLPEVRALRDAATQFAKAAMSGRDLGWPLVNLDAALAPFTGEASRVVRLRG